MRFSARLAASKGVKALVLEDAPRPTRIGFLRGVLAGYLGNGVAGYDREEPLDIQQTHQKFITLIREESEPWDYSEESTWAALTAHLKDCHWPEFYDFVELVGKLLQKRDDESPFSETEHFKGYQSKVNALLQEDGIGWSLDEKSELRRQVPRSLATRLDLVETGLTDGYANARVHYQKAVRYLYQHPIDEANSIKEIVSALESVAKVIVPKASTLGDAIKEMRKGGKYSSHLLDALERLYAYSNATPLVRHGHVNSGRPLLAEAELSLHVGVAYIRYLITP